MNPSEIQKIFQTVVKSVRCPHCGKRYSYENVHIVSTADSICFLQLECSGHVPMLATVSISGSLPQEVSVTPISTDDVINSYKKINKTNSIKKLFE
jgi:hypothetical protein